MGLFKSAAKCKARSELNAETDKLETIWRTDRRPAREKRREPSEAQRQQQDRVDEAFERSRNAR
jgi:hypothetical protein